MFDAFNYWEDWLSRLRSHKGNVLLSLQIVTEDFMIRLEYWMKVEEHIIKHVGLKETTSSEKDQLYQIPECKYDTNTDCSQNFQFSNFLDAERNQLATSLSNFVCLFFQLLKSSETILTLVEFEIVQTVNISENFDRYFIFNIKLNELFSTELSRSCNDFLADFIQ